MELALLVLVLFVATVIGAMGYFVFFVLPRQQRERNNELLAQLAADRDGHQKELELRLTKSQSEVANQQTTSFLNLAKSHLKQESELGEKALQARQEAIDKQLEGIGKELKSVQEYVASVDKAQAKSMAQVAAAVQQSQEATRLLQRDTQKLSEAMAGGQSRGQWGERVAEDVLRIAGFVEGVNYLKQQTTGEGSRPDYTFLLPDQRRLHMDVKMPMAAFSRYLEADTDAGRDAAAKEFLRDAKSRIKEVTTRDYINPAEGTLDYTLIFIPNEQVYGFIHEQDAQIVDFALQNHVVICSPLTLFAVLAVIRQSADNFRLEAKTREIQAAIGDFRKQWDMYKKQTEGVARAVGTLEKQWGDLSGVRERQLERSIEKIDDLRRGSDELLAPDVEPNVQQHLPAGSYD